MSQAGQLNSASGPVPPAVPTQFTTDTGVAIPVANNLFVLGDDTIVNDTDGLTTAGAGDTVTVLLTNRISVTSTTVGAVTNTVNLYAPPSSTSQTFRALVVGYDSANNETAGGEILGLSRVSAGGVVVVIGTNDAFDEADVALAATDWDFVTDGTNIQITFTGIAGRTIVWRATFDYSQVP